MWWPLAGLLDEEGSLSLPPASAAVTWVWHLGLINSHDASGALNTPRCHTLHPCHTPRTSYFSRCMLGYHRVPSNLTASQPRLSDWQPSHMSRSYLYERELYCTFSLGNPEFTHQIMTSKLLKWFQICEPYVSERHSANGLSTEAETIAPQDPITFLE